MNGMGEVRYWPQEIIGLETRGWNIVNRVAIRRNTLREAPRWVHGFAWGAFGTITFALLILYCYYRDTDVWFLWMGSPLKSSHAFAEAIHPGIFRTRANTWTNLSYIFVGLYVVAFALWDARRETTENDPYAVQQPALMGLFGVACIVLGFGSGLMHAAMIPLGHKLDVFGMFIALATLIALQWARWVPVVPFANRRWPTWPFFAIVAVAASVLLLVYGRELASGNVIVAALIGLVGLGIGVDVLSRNTSHQLRWLLLAFVSVAAAYSIWRLDRARQFTLPDAWLQGHAIWHVLTAASLGSMATFYRSEAPARDSTQ